jgi:hypothetical protein
MADRLTTTNLAEVLAAIKEVTKPYQLGIQLKIDSSELDAIVKNHTRDVDQQKIEVVKYWLRSSPSASWTTLAKAVEGMGGHARLAGRLREKEQSIMGDTTKLQLKEEEDKIHENPVLLTQSMLSRHMSIVQPIEYLFTRNSSETLSLDTCVDRNILLLGKIGHGKSTLGNRMLDRDGYFKINDQQCPQTVQGTAMIKSVSRLKNYKIEVYDHSGLFEGASSIDELSSTVTVPWMLNLVIFVLQHGCEFDGSGVEILKSVVSEWQISGISALVLTHCERLSEEERGEMIEQFKKDHPLIAELMGKEFLL